MKLYNNPEKNERECGKCHEKKPYIEFKKRYNGSEKVSSICKKCAIQIESNRLQMYSWVHKIEAIRFITKNQNKCQICGEIGIETLPMLDFHHSDPVLSSKEAKKEGFWRSIRYKPWHFIKKELNNQKVTIICRNCHAKINATFFQKYIKLIQYNDVPEKITSKLISEKYVRNELKAFIRKKIVLFDLWDGRCCDCGFGIAWNNIKNLPALEIHHLQPNTKSFNNFHKFCFLTSDIKIIEKILVEDNCICLCSNCHILDQSIFFNENKEEIVRKHRKIFIQS
ncbi:MAG: hypothetical protein ACFFA0_01760 [Promethearchaeota archaeon]